MIYAAAAGFVVGQLGIPGGGDIVTAWAAVVAALALVAWLQSSKGGRVPCAAAAVFALSLAYGGWLVERAERRPVDATHVASLSLPWRGMVVGVVREEPVRRSHRTTVVVEVERVGVGGNMRVARGLARLTLRRHRALHVGDRLLAWVTLRRPRSYRVPGAFDFAGYLARRGIHVTGSVWDAPALTRVGRSTGRAAATLARWRRATERALVHGVEGMEREVLAALVLGRGQTLSDAVRERFMRAGVLHVLVVSGLHLTLVAAAAVRIVEALLGRSERLLLMVDVRRAARLLSLLPIAAYVALVGPSVSVARAMVASVAAAMAVGCGRPVASYRLWALAVLVVGFVWPGSPREAAFQLSFASVAGVLMAVRDAPTHPRRLVDHAFELLRIAWMVAVVTAPVVAVHFDVLAPMGVVANPVVVPLFGGAVLGPGLLGAAIAPFSLDMAAWCFRAAGGLVRPGLGLAWVLGGPVAMPLPVPRPSAVEVAAFYALLGGWWGRRARLGRWLAAAALLVLAIDVAWWTWERWAPGRLRVAFLDVGQGDAAVVELADGRTLVVDAGGVPGSDFDIGRAVVEPYLRSRKIGRIDALVMSHAHPDHAAGLPRLIERFAPREFWWAGHGDEGPAWQAVAPALERGDTVRRVLRRGTSAPPSWAAVHVLHPPPSWSATSLNDGSLVLQVRAAAVRLLLTGDVERRAEAAFGNARGLSSEILKVPHHGSRTSSTPRWLEAVRPQVAVISVGEGNAYGLPAPDVEARYRALGACVLRTDRCGTIVVDARDGTLSVQATDEGCRCVAAQAVAPRPLRNANITRPTRSRTPSF
jgi:competence protein ComEC